MTTQDRRRQRFEALVADVHDPLTRYLRRRATSEDAEDIMSDVLLTLWRRIDTIPDPTPLPWCYGVARRALANHKRGDQRRLQLVQRIQSQPLPALEGDVDYEDLAVAIDDLAPHDREIIRLWAWEGLGPREIAAVIGTSPNAVSGRLARAKKKLAARMLRHDRLDRGHIRDDTSGEPR